MNERDVPQFDLAGVKSVIVSFNKANKTPMPDLPQFTLEPLSCWHVDDLAKQIIEYASLCGVIDQQSTMK